MTDLLQKDEQPLALRFALSLSLALCAHALLLASVMVPLPEAAETPSTVQVTLTNQSAQETAARSTSPSRQSQSSESANPPFEVEPLTPSTPSTAPSQETTTRQKPATDSGTPVADSSPAELATNAPATPKAPPQKASAASPTKATRSAASVSQQQRSTTETVPTYTDKLAIAIGRAIDRTRVRNISRLARQESVRLDLHLLKSGALTRVDIIESSGHKVLDRVARQGALTASPFPAIPADQLPQKRFEVSIHFRPEDPAGRGS